MTPGGPGQAYALCLLVQSAVENSSKPVAAAVLLLEGLRDGGALEAYGPKLHGPHITFDSAGMIGDLVIRVRAFHAQRRA